MAEYLLNEETRKMLADLLREAGCPPALDRRTFNALQRGERGSLSLRGLDALSRSCGTRLLRTLKGVGS